MRISYFRKSSLPFAKTLENVKTNFEKKGFTILGETEIEKDGKMVLVCKKDWVKTLINENYGLLGFLPCAISVFKKNGSLMVGTGTPGVLKSISQSPSIVMLASQADKEIKQIINESAGVEELKPKKVKLYSTMSCPYCKMEKSWLEQEKVEHEVVYVDLNSYEAQKMVDKTGQMGVPVTEIEYTEGEPEYIIGFDKPRLSEILGI